MTMPVCLYFVQLKRIPPHCLEGLRGVYSQLEVFTCSKSLSSLEVLTFYLFIAFLGCSVVIFQACRVCVCVRCPIKELLSLCGGDLSSALPWLELHTLNFSYNSIVCLDQSIVRPHKQSVCSATNSHAI